LLKLARKCGLDKIFIPILKLITMIALQFPMLLIKYASMQPLWFFVFLAAAFYIVLFLKALKFAVGLLNGRIKN